MTDHKYFRRGTLAKTRLGEFRAWLTANGYETRPGKGDYEVLQVKVGGKWERIWDKRTTKHLSVMENFMPIVLRFIRETRGE